MANLKIKKVKLKYLKQVLKLYDKSFPENEKFPRWILIYNLFRKYSDAYVLLDNKDLCGFVYLITYKNRTFILYLAISEEKRNMGYGTYILNWCLNIKKDNDIYLNIDDINEKCEDSLIRKKRLDFYLRNNFYLTDYISLEEGGNYNILTTTFDFNIDEYIELDKKIGKLFFNKQSEIVKKEEKNYVRKN